LSTRQLIFAADAPSTGGRRAVGHVLDERREPVALEWQGQVGQDMALERVGHRERPDRP
jgi:hypothetical protein